MTIFCDIDGTLTTTPGKPWGPVREWLVEKLKKRQRAGDDIVLWSGRGKKYVEEFTLSIGFPFVTCVSKPDLVIDDNPGIRPCEKCKPVHPNDWKEARG